MGQIMEGLVLSAEMGGWALDVEQRSNVIYLLFLRAHLLRID